MDELYGHERQGAGTVSELAHERAENSRLRELCNRQQDEIAALTDLADAVEVLREIGNLIGCDHVSSPDERRQLVNCMEQTLAGKDAKIDRLLKKASDLAAECDRLYRR